MKVNIYTSKKLQEADEIQNGDGESNASQETNTNTVDQTQVKNTDTTELSQQLVALVNRKTQLKTQYDTDIKVLNDQITLLQKQKHFFLSFFLFFFFFFFKIFFFLNEKSLLFF